MARIPKCCGTGARPAGPTCYTHACLTAASLIPLERAFENAAEEASKGGVAVFGASLADAKVRGRCICRRVIASHKLR